MNGHDTEKERVAKKEKVKSEGTAEAERERESKRQTDRKTDRESERIKRNKVKKKEIRSLGYKEKVNYIQTN